MSRHNLRAGDDAEPKNPFLFQTIPLVILLQGMSPWAAAAPGDTFTPFAAVSTTHDSNLLRINNALIGTETADTLRQAVAGMDVNWRVARQQILLTASLNENRFNRFSTLNYTGRDVRGDWNWRLADHLSGDLGYTNSRAIGSFADQQALVGNQRIQGHAFFDAFWLFHPSWQVGVGVAKDKLSFPDVMQRIYDREEDVRETSLQYLSSANNKVGIKFRETTGNYPNQLVDFVNMLDNGYRQREVLATMDWSDGGRSRLLAEAGSVRRTHDHFSRRNFSDVNARGTYSWQATGNVTLNVSAWRQIWAYDDLTTSYSRNRGVGLEPVWTPYSTVTVTGRLMREQRDFLGDPGLVVATAPRQDFALKRDLTVSYQPAPSYSFKLIVGDDRRDSNQDLFDFYSKTISFSATLQM